MSVVAARFLGRTAYIDPTLGGMRHPNVRVPPLSPLKSDDRHSHVIKGCATPLAQMVRAVIMATGEGTAAAQTGRKSIRRRAGRRPRREHMLDGPSVTTTKEKRARASCEGRSQTRDG